MTLATGTNRQQHAGNGSTTAFAFSYQYRAGADLRVILTVAGVETVQATPANYSVSPDGGASGTVTFVAAPPSGSTVTIIRDEPVDQPLEVSTIQSFKSQGFQAGLDHQARLAARAFDRATRGLRLPEGETTAEAFLPSKPARSGNVLEFDENGFPIAVRGLADYNGVAEAAVAARDVAIQKAADAAASAASASDDAQEVHDAIAIGVAARDQAVAAEAAAEASASSAAGSASTATTQAGVSTTKAAESAGWSDAAEAWAGASQGYASLADGSAATASTQAGVAVAAADDADASALIATTKAGEAGGSATGAATALDEFEKRYLGAKATPPTVDNDGGALMAGALYWNTTLSEMNTWSGSAWTVAYVPGGSTVTSFNGRSGAITPQAADYDSFFLTPVEGNALYQLLTGKDAANGYAGLDSSGKLLTSALPGLAITDTFVAASQAAMLALTAERGDLCIRSDINRSFALAADPATTLANWKELLTPTDTVLSVAGLTGAITAAGLRTALSLATNADPSTRAVLKGLDTTVFTTALLKEAGREGTFIWKAGDYSAQITADTQEGIYVKATAIAASAGAWVRVVDGPIDPRWFAAGTNDLTTALQAITALAQTDIAIRIPSGDFILTAAVAFVDKNVTIEGAGVGSTRLLCQNIAAKISFTDTSTTGVGTDLKRLNVSRLTIQKDHVTTAGAGGTAIEGTWNHTGPSSIEHASFTDLVIKGNGSTMFWHKGIRLVDVCSLNIDGCRIYNEVGHQTCLSAAAVEIVRNNCTNLIQFFVSNCFFGRYVDGFLFSQASAAVGAGTIEGFYLTNCEIINVARAFHEDNTALTTCSFDSIVITNCHVNASRNGFFVGRTKGLTISSCVWFFSDYGETSTPAPFTSGIRGVLLMEGVRIVNSQFVRFDPQATTGPLIQVPTATGLSWVRIDNCSISNFSAVADTTGTRSTEKAKLFYGQNNYVSSPMRTDTGFRGDRAAIAGSGSYVSGVVVPFNQVFENTPNVVATVGAASTGKTLGVSSITTTGFTITHSDGASALAIQWVAVG